jgi:hypothetical protein
MNARLPALLVAAALGVAACGDGEPLGAAGWERVDGVPLSPREGALGVRIGAEALLIGGSDAPPCPPTADCEVPDVPALVDGAAFDSRTRTWRRIADAPVPVAEAEGVVVGRSAYVLVHRVRGRPGSANAFLEYLADEDRWVLLEPPSRDPGAFHSIVAAGHRVVAFTTTDEHGESPDLVFDPAPGRWKRLPADPLSPSFDREMAWRGRDLVLFAKDLVPNPGAERPAVVRAAALDLGTRAWRAIPDSETPAPPDGRRGGGPGIDIPPPAAEVVNRTVVAAGRDVLVFGGARWTAGGDRGELVDEALIWSPAGAGSPSAGS